MTFISRLLGIVDYPIRLAALAMVFGYRRLISPRKGFRCAYSVINHGPSCSDIALDILREHNTIQSFLLIRRQLTLCRETFIEVHPDFLDAATDAVNNLSPIYVDDYTCMICDCK